MKKSITIGLTVVILLTAICCIGFFMLSGSPDTEGPAPTPTAPTAKLKKQLPGNILYTKNFRPRVSNGIVDEPINPNPPIGEVIRLNGYLAEVKQNPTGSETTVVVWPSSKTLLGIEQNTNQTTIAKWPAIGPKGQWAIVEVEKDPLANQEMLVYHDGIKTGKVFQAYKIASPQFTEDGTMLIFSAWIDETSGTGFDMYAWQVGNASANTAPIKIRTDILEPSHQIMATIKTDKSYKDGRIYFTSGGKGNWNIYVSEFQKSRLVMKKELKAELIGSGSSPSYYAGTLIYQTCGIYEKDSHVPECVSKPEIWALDMATGENWLVAEGENPSWYRTEYQLLPKLVEVDATPSPTPKVTATPPAPTATHTPTAVVWNHYQQLESDSIETNIHETCPHDTDGSGYSEETVAKPKRSIKPGEVFTAKVSDCPKYYPKVILGFGEYPGPDNVWPDDSGVVLEISPNEGGGFVPLLNSFIIVDDH